MRTALRMVGLGIVLCATLGGCGGGSVESAEICDEVSALIPQIANQDRETLGAHLDDWHRILDLTIRANDPELADYAEQVNKTDRQTLSMYVPLRDIQDMACR